LVTGAPVVAEKQIHATPSTDAEEEHKEVEPSTTGALADASSAVAETAAAAVDAAAAEAARPEDVAQPEQHDAAIPVVLPVAHSGTSQVAGPLADQSSVAMAVPVMDENASPLIGAAPAVPAAVAPAVGLPFHPAYPYAALPFGVPSHPYFAAAATAAGVNMAHPFWSPQFGLPYGQFQQQQWAPWWAAQPHPAFAAVGSLHQPFTPSHELHPGAPSAPQPSSSLPLSPPPPSLPLPTSDTGISALSPSSSRLGSLCAELGISLAEYEADAPLRALVHQLDALKLQQAQAQAAVQAQAHAQSASVQRA
jgi:hypothetical protein